MSPVLHTASLFFAAASGALLASVWQGFLLVACVALCFRTLPGLTAAVRSAIWTAVFVLIVLLPFLPRLASHRAAQATVGSSLIHVGLGWTFALASTWLLLSLARGLRLINGAVALARLARRATPVDGSAGFADLLGSGRRSAELCTSPDVDRPSVIGFFSPRILLPPDLLACLSPSELEQVLVHELEHLRRADDWRNLLQKLALTLLPLNPSLLWVERRLSFERELACDEQVVRLTRARKAYASCLTRLAEHSAVRHVASLALGAWERRPELVSRVHRILHGKSSRLGQTQLRLIGTALCLSVSAGAILLARTPALVSFTPVDLPAAPRQLASTAVHAMQPSGARGEQLVFAPAEMARTSYVTSAAPVASARPVRASFHVPVRRAVASRRPSFALPVLQTVHAAQHQLRQPSPAWVMTRWQTTAVPILIEGDRTSYAAVPTPDGWILLQL